MSGERDEDTAALQALGRVRAMVRAHTYRRGRRGRRRWIDDGDLLEEVAAEGSRPVGLGDPGSGARPSRRDPQAISGLAERFITRRGWRTEVAVGAVLGNWEQIVGAQVAQHCRVESFREGVLTVRTSSTAWATQLKLLLGQIERRLAEEVGEGLVTEIIIRGPAAPTWTRGMRVVKGRGPRDTYG
ncbi:MAG: DciA family protein [Bowdeniella nasicola]|nr:DciA family protein [Bowdeniella nasicola]